jgi:hypothetical protein
MSRTMAVVVGPLATATTTKVALSQKAAIAGTNYLVLNGAAGSFTVNSVCASQTPGGAGALTLNGTLASSVPTGTAIAYLPQASRIYITTAADESAKTFVVVGRRSGPQGGPYAVTETITGASTSTVSSIYQYDQIISITASGATSGAITVGHYGTATLDVARQILITDGGNDTGITFTLTGTDWYGSPITEAVTGASGATATSVLDYKTLTSISTSGAVATTVTIGTNGVAHSPWVQFDPYAATAPIAIQCTPSSAGANYTVQQTLDDSTTLNNTATYGRPDLLTWVNHPDTALVGATTTVQGNYAYQPALARVLLNSGTGTVTATFIQSGIFGSR